MSNNLSLEHQLAALEKLVSETPVTPADRVTWNTSRARAGFKKSRVFPALPSIPISDRNARAKVSRRKEDFSSQVAARYIPELLALLEKTRVAKVRASILGRLRFLRIEHLKRCRRSLSTSRVPELSKIEIAEFPKDVVSVLKSFRYLYPPNKSAPICTPVEVKASDVNDPCCFSYKLSEMPSEEVSSEEGLPRPQATITRHKQGKRRSIRTARFNSSYAY